MDELSADYYAIWTSGDHSLAVRVDALEQLFETGALSIPACGCKLDALLLADWASYDLDQLDREYDALMSPVTTYPHKDDPLDREVAEVASRQLSGYVWYLVGPLTFPLTTAALEAVRSDRTSSYRRPPHVPYLPGIVEDLQLMVGRERELDKRVSRKVRQLLGRLLAGRDDVCECFLGNATTREIEVWAEAKLRWWMDRASGIVARSRGLPEDVGEVWMDANWAAHVTEALEVDDEKHHHTRAVLERWHSLTPGDLAQPPAALHKQLQGAVASL